MSSNPTRESILAGDPNGRHLFVAKPGGRTDGIIPDLCIEFRRPFTMLTDPTPEWSRCLSLNVSVRDRESLSHLQAAIGEAGALLYSITDAELEAAYRRQRDANMVAAAEWQAKADAEAKARCERHGDAYEDHAKALLDVIMADYLTAYRKAVAECTRQSEQARAVGGRDNLPEAEQAAVEAAYQRMNDLRQVYLGGVVRGATRDTPSRICQMFIDGDAVRFRNSSYDRRRIARKSVEATLAVYARGSVFYTPMGGDVHRVPKELWTPVRLSDDADFYARIAALPEVA